MNLGLKLKTKRKINILTFMLVLALLQIITLSTLAGGNQLVITDSAFLNVGSGVVGNITLDEFTTPSFGIGKFAG